MELLKFSPTSVKNVMPARVYIYIYNYVDTKNINYNTTHEEDGHTIENNRGNTRIT